VPGSTDPIVAERLYGISFDPADINRVISSPGDKLIDRINLSGTLVKSVELAAFRVDDLESMGTSFDDIIFGGLGADFIHGGDGDDAVSGAEALPYYYAATGALGGFTEVNNFIKLQQNVGLIDPTVVQPQPFWFSFAPYNPGHVLAYQANYDGTKKDTNVSEFAYYDENAPRRTIMLDPVTAVPLVNSAPTARHFLLNFDATEGPQDTRWLNAAAGAEERQTDGDDRIFGDLGNDWIVGGTGRDHAYGGYGDDLINMDDDHNSPTVIPNGKPGKAIAGNLENNSPDDYQSYADITYGGAGRDVMILSSGFDRAVDWTGEFNSFLVPFSPFGAPSITRSLSPHVAEFLLDLSAADGADQGMPDGKLFIDQKQAGQKIDAPDPARHYEPFAELGMVRQKDADWNDQHGGPKDPQAGNLPGQHRDVRERAIEDVPPPQAAAVTAASALFSLLSASPSTGGIDPTAAVATTSGAPAPAGGSTIYWTGGTTAADATADGSSTGISAIDWSGHYLGDTASAATSGSGSGASTAIGMALPTFIVVQSQLAGDGTGALPAA
jgi:hypothetical protein